MFLFKWSYTVVISAVPLVYFFGMKAPNKPQKKAVKEKKALTEDVQKLAERIRTLRIAKGYSNYELFAYEHEISRSQFGRYEKGEDLRYSSLVKLVKAFGMTMQEFFAEGFDKK